MMRCAGLFLERMEVSAEVAAYKRSVGMAVLDPVREQALLARLSEGLDEAHAEAVVSLWKQILELSRGLQHRLFAHDTCPQAADLRAWLNAKHPLPTCAKVACPGPRRGVCSPRGGGYVCPTETIFFPDWASATDAVLDGRCSYGVLPIENSTCGSVSARLCAAAFPEGLHCGWLPPGNPPRAFGAARDETG